MEANLAVLYRRRLAELEQLLADAELGSEAMDLIRSMITQITVVPRAGACGVDLELAGDLARILHLCSTSTIKQTPRLLALGVWVFRRMKCRWLRGSATNFTEPW